MGLTTNSALPWLKDVDVFEQAIGHVNWDTVTIDTGALMNGYKSSTGAQNAEINFDLVLARGTWTIELLHAKTSNVGIYTIQLDGSTVGTIDGYDAGLFKNTLSSITGIAVLVSAKYRLKLLMATKNASASAYYGFLHHVQLRRTA